MTPLVDIERHPIGDGSYVESCRRRLDADGALVLEGFFTDHAVAQAIAESGDREREAFFATTTHNVFLTDGDPSRPETDPINRQLVSSKGIIADDQIPAGSPLRELYDDAHVRRFLCGVLGVDALHPYADDLSSVNVHFAPTGRELGWHFDNSSFAVTMLLRAADAGGRFEYVPKLRTGAGATDGGGSESITAVLDGEVAVRTLAFSPGDLVVFRGREALHRVTPTQGPTTRMLVVFAFNDEPGIGLSESALATFYGRTSTTLATTSGAVT